MKSLNTKFKAAGAAVVSGAMVLSMAACGSGDDTANGDDAPKSDGPVKIEVWGWDQFGEQVAEAFNKAQDDVEVKYVTQASNTITQQNFRNAFDSKSGMPDWVQGFSPVETVVSNGWAEDITDVVNEYLADDYTDNAKEYGKLNGKYYSVPASGTGAFAMINTDLFAKYGFEAPKTWDEAIEMGKKMQADNPDVKLFNLAGEDPSTLEQMAQLSGASWFTIDGDHWNVSFLDEGTKKAADIIQQLIDNKLVSNETYQDKASLYKFFDSGNLAMMTAAYWSVTNMKANMPNTAGKWETAMYPKVDAGDAEASPNIMSSAGFVPSGTSKDHAAAVMKYLHWINTPEGYESQRDPETGTISVPAGLTTLDTEKYVKENVTKDFFNDDAQAADTITKTADVALTEFGLGPNFDAWFPELQDQWGKAVAGQQTVEDALKKTQDFAVKDLESKGIDYKVVND